MSDFVEFGFGTGDDAIGGGRVTRFKGKEGENYRVSFVWWDEGDGGVPDLDAATPKFVGTKRHFINGVGYVLAAGPEMQKLAGGPPKTTIATILAIWPTDKHGTLDKGRFTAGDVTVQPWVFSRDKYDQLKRRHEEFPFGSHDLAIACTDSQYQKMDLSPCRESLFRKVLENDKLRDKIGSQILATVAELAANIKNDIAQVMTVAQVKEKLGGGGGGTTSNFSAEIADDVDDLLDELVSD